MATGKINSKRATEEAARYTPIRAALTYAIGFIATVTLLLLIMGAAGGGVLPIGFLLLTAVYYGIPIGCAVALFVYMLRRRSPDRRPASIAVLTTLFGSALAILMISVQAFIAEGARGFGDVMHTVYLSSWFAAPVIFALIITAIAMSVTESKRIRYHEALRKSRR